MRLIDFVIASNEPTSKIELAEDPVINFKEELNFEEDIIVTEYLEDVIEEEADEEEVEVVEFIKTKPKKVHKKALCGLCGKSYYKDVLQRHIDKVHFKVKRCKKII